MGKVAVIVSLYPAAFFAQRPSFTPQREFRIRRCANLDEPQICVVEDQEERPYIGLGRTGYQTWDAKLVAEDIANEWAGGALGRSAEQGDIPAIWVSEGAQFVNGKWVIPQEELDAHRKQQDGVLRRLYQLARVMFEKSKTPPLDVMLHAAEMLKIAGEPWQQELTSDARFACPYCDEVNRRGVAVCKNCNNILDKAKYDALRQSLETAQIASEPGAGKLSADDKPADKPAAVTPPLKPNQAKPQPVTA